MENEETTTELTTEQKTQRAVTGAMDVLVLVQAVLVTKRIVTFGLTKIRK